MIELNARSPVIFRWPELRHCFRENTVTVHPFYRPDSICKHFLSTTGGPLQHTKSERVSGENRTKHSTKLGAVVGEMIEALGGVNDA